MTNSRLYSLAALLMSVALTTFGCATQEDTTTDRTTTPEPTAEVTQEMESGEILHVLRTINQGEISQAQLALERSENLEVQQTAETILEAHRELDGRIDRVAEDADIQLQENRLSSQISDQASQFEDELSQVSGEEFDRKFLQQRVELNDMALQTARNDLMPNATDSQVRQLLSDASEHLENNLVVAQRNLEDVEEAVGGGPEEQQEEHQEDENKKMEDDEQY